MALIATAIDAPGVARLFFDLRALPTGKDDETRIARTIERAFAQAVETNETVRQAQPA